MRHKNTYSIHNLSSEQLEDLILLAEQIARKYILSQISSKEIKNLDILIEFDTTNELKLDCIIELQLVKHSKLDPQKVTDEAVKKIFEIFEKKYQ